MLVPVIVLSVLALATSSPVSILGKPSLEGRSVPMLDGRIIGGSAVDIRNYPYQLSLQYSSQHICGASIISADWALTAAHCTVGSSTSVLRFRAGSTQHASGGSLHQVSSGYIHGSYDDRTVDYDISVLRVSTAFPLGSTGVQRVALIGSGSSPSTGATATVSGWGVTTSGSNSVPAALRAVDVQIISTSSCSSSYGSGSITARMICAGVTNGGRDACQGDSGGPLVVGSSQVGIVSWGRGCALAGYPGVYTNIGNLRSWVSTQTGV